MLKLLGLGSASAVLSACAGPTPQVVEKVVKETVEVEKVVKETVEVEKVVTKEVEKVVTATPAPSGPRTIQMSTWAYSPAEEQLNKDLIAKFGETHAPDKVELVLIPGENYNQKLEIMSAGGIAPDVIYWDPDVGYSFYSKGWFRSLQPYFDTNPDLTNPDLYAVSAYKTSNFGGEQYAVPNGTYCNLVFYNKDLFDKEGVAYPAGKWTWSDYVEVAKKLTKMEGSNFTQFGTILQYFNAYWTWDSLVWGEGGDLFDKAEMPTKCTLDNDAGYFAWQWIQDLVYKHKVAPPAAQQSALGGDFGTGKVAMYIDGTWAISSYTQIEAFKWDLADLPGGSKETATPIFTGCYWLTQQSKEPDLGWEYLQFLLSEDGQMIFAANGMTTPVLKKAATSDVFLNLKGAPEHHLLRMSAIDNYGRGSYYYHPEFAEIQSKIWGPEMDLVLLNEKTGKEAIDTVVAKTNEMLAG